MTAPIVATLPTAAAAVRAEPAYKRVLLKLSGEALMGDDPYGINREVIDRIVAEIGEIVRLGVPGGAGDRVFTAGSAAELGGGEMGVDVVVKARKVDGVYACDRERDPAAER